jgi:arylsulfatase A-like enzyme
MKERPNILWICTEQQRHDTIHALGNPYINTPNLDCQAKQGVAFENAYTQCPICTPSRATFLTGRYPASHHVKQNGNDHFPGNEVLVTKLLADAGYNCGLVGKLHLSRGDILEKRPKNDGYRFFKWSHHPNPDYPHGHAYADWLKEVKGVDPKELYGGLSGSVGPGVPDELHQTTWCTEMAIEFIKQKRNEPWLLSINPFDPHPPFDPPKEYLDRYNVEDLPYPLFKENDIERQKSFREIDQQTRDAINPYKALAKNDTTQNVPRGDMGSIPPNDYNPRYVKACYYAMIEKIDNSIGQIIKILKETGQYKNTIIIFHADHGELLGDHGLIYKGCRFFESLVHIPLIISWPAKAIKNVRSSALVELVDLAPTLLDAAGLEIPYYMQGKSLFPILIGEKDCSYHKPYVISEYQGTIGGDLMKDQTHGFMYYDGRYKIAIYQGRTSGKTGEIYDLKEDPGEFNNLWDNLEYKDLKADLVYKAFSAYINTSDTGILRTGVY